MEPSKNSLSAQLDSIQLAEAKLQAKKLRTLEKAMKSDSPTDMIKASQVIDSMGKKMKDNSKAYFIDPLQFNAQLGYKDKNFSLSYTTLKRMSKAPIIKSIINTRKNQVADFAEPQEDKYSTGFVIRKKKKYGIEQEMTDAEKKTAYAIQEFLMNGGDKTQWCKDDFDTFIRKLVFDTLVYDQMTFEVIRNRRQEIVGFQATDASTFRISESYFEEEYNMPYFGKRGVQNFSDKKEWGKEIMGYRPAYVQIYQTVKVNEFYPWELCFAVRNASTSIYANGYGCSELEDLINVVTSMLYGDEYNRRFFSQGSAPKGLLRIKGVNNEAAVQQFRQQWQSMISGVMQSWKTPVVEADVDWIDLQKNNRDMEYSSWMEYLIKIACAVYNIDPIEIGWDISRGSGNSGLFEGSEAERLANSKDKGLYPLLKFIQRKINKYIVEQINPDFEFVFVGMNGLTVSEELELDIKKVQNFQTMNEIREKYGLKEIKDGDIPLNSAYLQAKNSREQREQQAQLQAQYGGGMAHDGQGYEETEEEDAGGDEEGWTDEDWENLEFKGEEIESSKDKLIKAFDNFFNEIENGTN